MHCIDSDKYDVVYVLYTNGDLVNKVKHMI